MLLGFTDQRLMAHGGLPVWTRFITRLGLRQQLRAPVRTLCRHDDAGWTQTWVVGIEVQDVTHDGARLLVLRQRVAERPHAGGK